MKIIGVSGLIGSGKNTVASYISEKYEYGTYSWAEPLKDTLSSIFGWDRALLEGDSIESREFRTTVDVWWSEQLGFTVTPRLMMQQFGTNLMRDKFHDNIWVMAGLKRIQSYDKVVVSDVRFLNEANAILQLGGEIWRVQSDLPKWWDDLTEIKTNADIDVHGFMHDVYPDIHISEYASHSIKPTRVLYNTSTFECLYEQIDSIFSFNNQITYHT